MQQQPKIIEAPEKTIIGLRLEVTLQEMKTQELWRSFGERRNEILHRNDMGNYSVQVYGKDFLTSTFLPTTIFDKWAGVGVSGVTDVPEGMEVLVVPSGVWAVFTYKGRAQDFHNFATYIFGKWLPQSGYKLWEAPHFEYMPEGYAEPNNPEAKEEVWIPVQKA